MKLTKNDIIPLKIEAMTSDGSGIGRHDGMAIFVPMTAIGDEIEAKIVKVEKRFAYGIMENLKLQSPDRIEIDCPYFKQCGGCVYRHISYESECKIKRDRVKDCLERIGGFSNIEIEEIISANNRNYYRNKAQIPLGLNKDGKLLMGFYAKHSHRIIDSQECLLQPKVFKSICDTFRIWFAEFGDTIYDEKSHKGVLRHLYIREGEKTGELMVCVVINGTKLKDADKLVGMMKLHVPEVSSIIINSNTQKTNVILGKKLRTIAGTDTISDILCDLKFHLSPLSFYQVNRTQAEKLYKKAAEYASLTGNETLLDLYCGTGTIGLSMAKMAKKLIGVEIIPEAIDNAKINAHENGIENAEFICGDATVAAKLLEERGEKPDVIIVDPPRKGCSPELIEIIAKMSPKRLVYISCDPATLGRDLRRFADLGYEPKKATPCDLFPGTSHVETVVLMSRVDE